MRQACTFRERDLRAAMRVVEKAGKEIHAVEIEPNGTIRISTVSPAKAEIGGKGWDDV